jgi:hypothetical protein
LELFDPYIARLDFPSLKNNRFLFDFTLLKLLVRLCKAHKASVALWISPICECCIEPYAVILWRLY